MLVIGPSADYTYLLNQGRSVGRGHTKQLERMSKIKNIQIYLKKVSKRKIREMCNFVSLHRFDLKSKLLNQWDQSKMILANKKYCFKSGDK